MKTFNLHTRFVNNIECYIENRGTKKAPRYCAKNARTNEPMLFINIDDDYNVLDGMHDTIIVKDYSENQGLTDCLVKEGLIEESPVLSVMLAFCTSYAYHVTKKFYECVK